MVLGKFKLYEGKEQIKVFKQFKCDGCQRDLSRPNLRHAYGCTVCDERLCEVCTDQIAFEPLVRLKSLCSKQTNLNHWCHGARSSTRWQEPANSIDMGNKISGWAWKKLAHRIPHADYIFERAEGYKAGSSENARLKKKTVRKKTPPAECRIWREGDRHRRW